MYILDSVFVAFMGGVLTLDRTAVFQVMLSRPIVASTVIGYLLGDPLQGLVTGFLLELLWLGELPVGARITTNETALTIVMTSVSLLSGPYVGGVRLGLIVFVILLFLPLGWVFKKVDRAIREFNSYLSQRAITSFEEKGEGAIDMAILKGIMAFFIPNAILIWLFVFVGVFLVRALYPYLGEMEYLLEGIFYILPVVGIGSVISSLKVKGYLLVYAAGYILFSFLLL